MIRVKVSDLLNVIGSLNELIKYKLPWRSSYAISLLVREVNYELTVIQSVMRKILEGYATPDSKGNIIVPDERKVEFDKEMSPFLESTIVLNANFLSQELFDTGDLCITPDLMMPLLPFIGKINDKTIEFKRPGKSGKRRKISNP